MANEELVQEYQNGNKQALDELMQQNTGLVKYFVNKYWGIAKYTSLEFTDLEQEGWIGFIDAVEKYNPKISLDDEEPERTVLFSSYAGRAIQTKILRVINRNIPREKKSDTYSEQIMVNSINELLPGADDRTLEAMLPDDKSMVSFDDVEANIDNQILRKDLLEMLDSVFGGEFQYIDNGHDLNGVENIKSLFYKLRDGINSKEVLLLHYGLFGKSMAHQEIGKKVGLSGSRIEQIEFAGIKCIRNSRPGKEFMNKYELGYMDELKERKESINQYISPEKVLKSMEIIDGLLKKYASGEF